MVNYNNGIIYKICCKDTDVKEIYIGSTVNFKARKCQHKECCDNKNSKAHNFYVYKFIRDHQGWENWSMIQIKSFPCDTKRELETEERRIIEDLKPELNKNIPNRTLEEKKEYNLEYQLNNKEMIAEQRKEYYEKNKDKTKEYYENNKQIITEKKKEYRENNKQIIAEKRKVKYTCECGSTITKHAKTRHERSQKHQNFILNN